MSESPNVGLYSGNVIIEYNTDQKCVKPVVKANEKATPEEITKAVMNAIYALNQASFELDHREYIIPDPLKQYIVATLDNMTKQKELERQYQDNDEITNNEQTGVDHHVNE